MWNEGGAAVLKVTNVTIGTRSASVTTPLKTVIMAQKLVRKWVSGRWRRYNDKRSRITSSSYDRRPTRASTRKVFLLIPGFV